MLQPARSHGRAIYSSLHPVPCPSLASTSTLSSILGATACVTSPAKRLLRQQQQRCVVYSRIAGLGETVHPVAHDLNKTGVWNRTTGSKSGPKPKEATVTDKGKAKGKGKEKKTKPKGDRTRVNIVNPDLVKDIIDYIKPTLKRHEGCDLISVYPGAGLWSSALHKAVKPRSHLLLEPDTDLYGPMLQPLLKKKGVQMVPKSGIIWDELNQVLTPEFLPHQKEVSIAFDEAPPRNDTLLIDINLSMFPKRKFQLFESLSRMVLFQLLVSLRSSSLYQKYGQVRMLIWIPDDEKAALLPRVLVNRHRLAMEGELSTEYIAEVCGLDTSADLGGKANKRQATVFTEAEEGEKPEKLKAGGTGWNTKRWGQLDLESVRMALARMEQAGIKTPPGRETMHLQKFKELGRSLDEPFDLTEFIQLYTTQTQTEFDILKAERKGRPLEKVPTGPRRKGRPAMEDDPKVRRMAYLRNYHLRLARDHENSVKFVKEHEEIMDLYARAAALPADAEHEKEREVLTTEIHQLEEAFINKLNRLPNYQLLAAMGARDSHHLMRQPAGLGPVMSWDRRPYEPLKLDGATDFFPNVPCALLDIQPKAPAPVLRSIGPGSDKSGDMFDLLMGSMLSQRRRLVTEMLDVTWPGARDGLLPGCPSLTDPARGGVPLHGPAGITVRSLNQVQLMEIMEAFKKWPFRPSWEEMVGRLSSDSNEDIGTFGSGNDDAMGNVTLDAF